MLEAKVMLVVLSEERLNQFERRLDEIASNRTEEDFSKSYIESKSVPKLLGISLKTWQTYRDRGAIPFIQFGSKIWVKRVDLDAFLERHYVNKHS